MRTLSVFLSVAFLVSAAPIASAAIITYDYSLEYSGSDSPVGAAPWLRATFGDSGSSGSVMLTLTALNLTGSEYVNDVYFNLDPALNPGALVFTPASASPGVVAPTVLTNENALSAGGSTDFDIQLDFPNAPPSSRFGAGDSIQFTITGIPTLTATSFDFLSVPGGQGPFPTAAKIQGIGPTGDGSGWVTVPEPATLGLSGLAVLTLLRRRRAGK